MTLFTRQNCTLCDQLKQQFDLNAMQVHIEELDNNNAAALAHLAWHGLVETARKTLPLLVLDDSSTVDEFSAITSHLASRAEQFGVVYQRAVSAACKAGSCALN